MSKRRAIVIVPPPKTERDALMRSLAEFADAVHIRHLRLLAAAAESWANKVVEEEKVTFRIVRDGGGSGHGSRGKRRTRAED